MPASLELDELVDHLPDPHELGIQAWISNQAEYVDLTTYGNEIPSGQRADFMKHQRFIRRLMYFNNDLMLLWDTGSGKTLGMSSVSEYYREHPGEIRHVYILVSSDTQVEEFSKQIVCKASNGYYENEASKYARTEQGQKRNINKRLKSWYTITTYIRFSNMINEMYPTPTDNEKLARDFSGCIFMVDEVQNLRLSQEEIKEERQRGDVYTAIWRVFHLMRGGKRIIASATPMTERAEEIGPIMNLIQPLDKQFYDPYLAEIIKSTQIQLTADPIPVNWEAITAEQLIPLVEGRISYITASQTGASPEFIGRPVEFMYQLPRQNYSGVILNQETVGIESKLILDPCYMLEHQTKAYLSSLSGKEREVSSFSVEDESESSSWQHAPRQALCWVFPDGSYGVEAFMRYVSVVGHTYTANAELKAWMADPQYLRQMSAKAARIVEGAITQEGKRYVYSRYVRGGGAIMLGLALEEHAPQQGKYKGVKFTKFNEMRSVFISGNITGRVRPYCAKSSSKYEYTEDDAPSLLKLASNKKDRIIRPDFKKAPRYALLTKDTPESEKAAIFELFNSPENTMGEYIQVIIVSPVGQIGINLFDVLHVDIFTPEWVPNLIYQSRNRAFRVVSHINILKYLRKKHGPQFQLKVPVHYYACYVLKADGKWHDTLDSNMYKKSEFKDIKIKRAFRVLKKTAVDCYINLPANTRYTEDGSPECDYMECKYTCVDVREEIIRTDTYKAFFREEIVEKYKKFLNEYWQVTTSSSISQMINYYYRHNRALPSEYNEEDLYKYFIFTLEDMITNRTIVHDRFGMPCYIENTGNTYYLSHRHPDIQTKKLTNVITSGIYTSTLTAVSQTELKDVAMDYETEVSLNIIKYIYDTDIEEGLKGYIRGLKPEGKIRLLEDAVIRHELPEFNVNPTVSMARLEFVISMFINSIMVTGEPVDSIKRTAATIGEIMRQKNIKQITMKNMPPINLNSLVIKIENDADPVFIHNIYVVGQNVHGRNLTSKYYKVDGRLRLFNPKKGFWRDLTLYEAPVYAKIFQIHLENMRSEFNRAHKVYGRILSANNEFRIVDNREGAASRSGRIATKMSKYDLIDILYFIGHKNLSQAGVIPDLNKSMADEIRRKYSINTDDWSDEKLNFFNYWSKYERKIDELASRIALHMYYSSKGSMIESDTEKDPKDLIWQYVKSLGYSDIISDYDETVPKTPSPEDVVDISYLPTPDFQALALQAEKKEDEKRRARRKKAPVTNVQYFTTDAIVEQVAQTRRELDAQRQLTTVSTANVPTMWSNTGTGYNGGVSVPFSSGRVNVPFNYNPHVSTSTSVPAETPSPIGNVPQTPNVGVSVPFRSTTGVSVPFTYGPVSVSIDPNIALYTSTPTAGRGQSPGSTAGRGQSPGSTAGRGQSPGSTAGRGQSYGSTWNPRPW